MTPPQSLDPVLVIERVQTGVRMERRMVKVLKALAEYHDIGLGELLEGIVLHAFEGRSPFSSGSLEAVTKLKAVYGMTYGVEAAHRLTETATDLPASGAIEATKPTGAPDEARVGGATAERSDPGDGAR